MEEIKAERGNEEVQRESFNELLWASAQNGSEQICRWRYAARRSARSQNRKCTLFTFNESSDIRGAFVLKYESGSCPSRSCSYCFIE